VFQVHGVNRHGDLDGRLIKRQFPSLTMLGFRLLARMRPLRGGAFDIFGKTAERHTERQLITDYEKSIHLVLSEMTAEVHDIAMALARLPN
jgi:indolepyruvate ferredoxin oxidoreductase